MFKTVKESSGLGFIARRSGFSLVGLYHVVTFNQDGSEVT